MNILLERLPTSVMIDNAEFEINSDFRTSVRFELLMQNHLLSDEEKTMQGLLLYYGDEMPVNLEEAVNAMLWFYKGGKDSYATGKGTGKKASQIYSFEHDDTYIYAAFLSQYRVDLNETNYLHWWKFKALFQALSEDNEIVKIMGYRSMTIDNNLSKEQKAFYKRMKEQYKLPLLKDEKEKISEIEQALLNNENVEGLL